MLTTNVHYSERPHRFEIQSNGQKACVECPLNITEVETEEGTEFVAASVYSLETVYTPNLAERIEANFEAWLKKAKEPEMPQTTLEDVVEAVNMLQELIIGGEF